MERAQLEAVLQNTLCAEQHGDTLFLCDPQWSATERAQVAKWQTLADERAGSNGPGWLCVATGGTSGGVRFARHDEHTLGAAVQGFCDFFELERVNAVDVLPSYHVSGLMARVRCAATGGQHVPCDWRRIEAGERPSLDHRAGAWVISLVPTQLQRLLASAGAADWLRGFRAIFVGGGPTWPELIATAAAENLPIALSYGMTETAAMVAAIKPADFLKGERTFATVMPHARVTLTPDGVISVAGESVFRGYYPELCETRQFETDDLGQLDEHGRLQVFGRKDAVIITGGKKVQPTEVEAALLATGQFADVAVLGIADAEWGQTVVACYPQGATADPVWSVVERELENRLASYKRPKRYVAMVDWPRNQQGKLSRSELARRIESKR